MIKEKRCNGTGRAKGYGCGELVPVEMYGKPNRVFGLGKQPCKCYQKWLTTSDEGKKILAKSLIGGKEKFAKEKKQKWNIEKQRIKTSLETKSDIESKLQKEINTIVRLLDKGHECISSGRELGKNYDAGHLYTVGGNPTLRFNLFNIFAQSVHDNQHKSGNELEYFLRLETVFNKELQGFVLSLKQLASINLEKHELKDAIDIARSIVKWLKLQDRNYSKQERIDFRNLFNKQLNIYPEKYCEFK